MRTVLGLMGSVVALDAHASPWQLEPGVSASTEYQSNPAYRVRGGSATTQAVIGIALPARWREGRHAIDLNLDGHYRGGRGEFATADASDLSLGGAWERAGERSSFRLSGGVARTDTLGTGTAGLGVDRVNAVERTTRGGVESTWLASPLSTVAFDARWSARRFEGGAASGYVDSDEGSATLTYLRALSPALQLVASLANNRFRPDLPAGESSSTSLQAGFAWQPVEPWSLRLTAGRSRARIERLGAGTSGAVYDVQTALRTELGSVSASATQTFQSSAFGALVRERSYRLVASRALTARTALGADLAYVDARQAFFGFDVFERRTEAVGATATHALSEAWSVVGALRVTRERYPATLVRTGVPAATSASVSVGVSRRFGATRLF
jgi:hypothetical protein